MKTFLFPLPDIAHPTSTLCVQINIPNEPQHIANFWGNLWNLTRWYNYKRDANHSAADIAQTWIEVFDQARQSFLSGSCGEMVSVTYRQVDCDLQISTDGGITWASIYTGDTCSEFLRHVPTIALPNTIEPPNGVNALEITNGGIVIANNWSIPAVKVNSNTVIDAEGKILLQNGQGSSGLNATGRGTIFTLTDGSGDTPFYIAQKTANPGDGYELRSLKGADGQPGSDGRDGADGSNGSNGRDGTVIAEVHVFPTAPTNDPSVNLNEIGTTGTYDLVLTIPRGQDGSPGSTGSAGRDGVDGQPGQKGDKGDKGDPGQDCECGAPTPPTPKPPDNGKDNECIAAANAGQQIDDAIAEIAAKVQASASFFTFAAVLTGVIAAFMSGGTLGAPIIAVFAAFQELIATGITAIFTSAIKEELVCIIYKHTPSTRIYTSADISAIVSAIDSDSVITGIAATIYKWWISAIGANGLTAASQAGTLTDADCSRCNPPVITHIGAYPHGFADAPENPAGNYRYISSGYTTPTAFGATNPQGHMETGTYIYFGCTTDGTTLTFDGTFPNEGMILDSFSATGYTPVYSEWEGTVHGIYWTGNHDEYHEGWPTAGSQVKLIGVRSLTPVTFEFSARVP